MPYPWFRFYSEFSKDPKVQSLDEKLQRRLVMFFCLQCSGELPHLSDDELSFALGLSSEELQNTKSIFTQKGFIDKDGTLSNWSKRQRRSDVSTARTRAFRQRQRDALEAETEWNGSGTVPNQFPERKGTVPRTDMERNGNVLDRDIEKEEEEKKLKQKKVPSVQAQAEQTQGDALSGVCDFSKFWKEYPNKVDRKKAKFIFEKINPDESTLKKIMSGLRKQKRGRASREKTGEFTPAWKNPIRWLRGECWMDEGQIGIQASSGIVKRLELSEQDIKKLEAELEKTTSRINAIALEIITADDRNKIPLFDMQSEFHARKSSIENMLRREGGSTLDD